MDTNQSESVTDNNECRWEIFQSKCGFYAFEIIGKLEFQQVGITYLNEVTIPVKVSTALFVNLVSCFFWDETKGQ